jgi:hypothetical protein
VGTRTVHQKPFFLTLSYCSLATLARLGKRLEYWEDRALIPLMMSSERLFLLAHFRHMLPDTLETFPDGH